MRQNPPCITQVHLSVLIDIHLSSLRRLAKQLLKHNMRISLIHVSVLVRIADQPGFAGVIAEAGEQDQPIGFVNLAVGVEVGGHPDGWILFPDAFQPDARRGNLLRFQ